jgi:hypothetical protein
MDDGAVVACGQVFSAAVIKRLSAAIREHPQCSRAEIARQLCQWLDWRSANGKLKEMSARSALLQLQRRGLITLPPPRRSIAWRGRSCGGGKLKSPTLGPCSLAELGRIELVLVNGNRQLSQRWKEVVEAHHYLGYRPLCGAQLRYLVRCRHGDIGALGFSAPAYRLKARDRWIGWSEAARRLHLQRVVCNSRFVLAGGLKVANLASKVLALAARRLPADWQKTYGYQPVLLETYVERRRFGGTCYRAANWTEVGCTRGRGRNDRHHRRQQSVKDIYLYALDPNWRELLCEEPGPARLAPGLCRAAAPPAQERDWASEEFAAVRLRDGRHRQRLVTVARDFFAQPQANIPQACCSRIKTKAAYRFFAHAGVSMKAILATHYDSTMHRIERARCAVVLAVQDTTSFNYSTHDEMEGLGPIGTSRTGPQGVMLHDTVVYDTEGTALGLIDAQVWARNPKQLGKRHKRYQRPIDKKESSKWLKSFAAAARLQRQLAGHTTVVSVGDREADVYELFVLALADPAHPRLLVRAERDRLLADGQGHLWEHIEGQAVAGRYRLDVPRRKGRPGREALIEVRHAEVELKPPKRKAHLGAVRVWVVLATELDAPCEQDGVEWMLLTTAEVTDFTQARDKVEWYKKRWSIEEYHRTLKSGCRIEDRQLQDRTNWEKCLAVDLVVAWRIEHLKKLSRHQPQEAATIAYETHEIEALCGYMRRPPQQGMPSIREMTRMVAQLGGFLGRKSDGEPGSITLTRGLHMLHVIVTSWQIFTALHLKKNRSVRTPRKRPVSSLRGYG